MVNRGRSAGCHTCKKRRVKCDETKPRCNTCRRLRLECSGYGPQPLKIRFKADTHGVPLAAAAGGTTSVSVMPAPASRQPIAKIQPLALQRNYVASGFFLSHWAVIGRGRSSSRGFFEMLMPVTSREMSDSPANLALAAVSEQMYNRWTGRPGSFQPSQRSYLRAIARLQAAINDPSENQNYSTVLATLILQFYDNLVGVFEGSRPRNIHQEGAKALLQHQFLKKDDEDSSIGGARCGLSHYVLHAEVATALRAKCRVPQSILALVPPEAAPLNLSAQLDLIGVMVADLQYRHITASCQSPPDYEEIRGIQNEARSTEGRLRDWLDLVPESWIPLEGASSAASISRFETYFGTYDVYPSVQIGSIWNLWRSYRLIILGILRQSEQIPTHKTTEIPKRLDPATKEIVMEIVGGICRSVPFFLGNHLTCSTLHHLTDPTLVFPSYHNTIEYDPGRTRAPVEESIRSYDDHVRHVVAQGAWHIYASLSQLQGYLKDESDNIVKLAISEEKMLWIEMQFRRAGSMIGL